MADELLSALGELRREELATDSVEGDPVHTADPRLTTAERARVLEAVFAKLDAEGPAPPARGGATPTEAKVLTHSRWRPAVLAAALLAIAAALVLVLARPSASIDELAPLPSFSITRLEGGVASVRSDPGAGPLQLRTPHDAIEIVITPDTRLHDQLAVVVVARPSEGVPHMATITNQVEHSPDGAIRIHGPLDRFIPLGRGTWKIDWLLSRVGAEPRSVADLDDAVRAGAWRRATTEAIIASD